MEVKIIDILPKINAVVIKVLYFVKSELISHSVK